MAEANEGTADPRLEAEGELSMARLALDGDDPSHAASHVANAVVRDPTLPEIHELLAQLAAHPRGGPDLFPLEESVFLGTVVCRAHVLASRGEVAEALGLLVSAQSHQPDGRWADVAWMYAPDLGSRLSAQDVCAAIHRLIPVVNEPPSAEQEAALRPYLFLARSAAAAYPQHAMLLWTASILLRRCGDLAEAVDLALGSEAAEPSHYAAIALGYAYRSQQRWAEAEQAWLRALEHDPGNLALFTDIGELLAEAGRPDDGLAWVERALEREPQHASAFPTACAMRFGRDSGLVHLVALADHLREHPGNGHADRVLADQCQTRFWLGPLPGPTEAVTNMMWQVLEQHGPSGTQDLMMALSAPEPPSAQLAFGRALPGCTVDVAEGSAPDPRRAVPEVFDGGPVRGVVRRVWGFEGTRPRPEVPPPSPEAARTVRDVAQNQWRHPVDAYDAGVRLSGLALPDLLGVLVHPPQLPQGDPALWPYWIRLVQTWACLGIAHYEAEQPWEVSERRAVLVDLAYGPEDWVSEAALFALAATAWTQPDTRADIASLVGWRLLAAVEASSGRPVTILGSLAHLVHAVPDMHPNISALAADVLADLNDAES